MNGLGVLASESDTNKLPPQTQAYCSAVTVETTRMRRKLVRVIKWHNDDDDDDDHDGDDSDDDGVMIIFMLMIMVKNLFSGSHDM